MITDCHSRSPLRNYIGCEPPESGGVLFPGADLKRVLVSFCAGSSAWRGPQLSEHAILMGQLNDHRNLGELTKSPLSRWTSCSLGADYSLGWTQQKPQVDRRGVRAVARNFDEMAQRVPGFASQLDFALALERGFATATTSEQAAQIAELTSHRRRQAAQLARTLQF